MLTVIDDFFLEQPEPSKSCLLFLRRHILASSPDLTEHWKYGMPFYYYRGKPCCYLWKHKKFKMPYVSFVNGNKMKSPGLLLEARARMKIFLIDPAKDIPVKKLNALLREAMQLGGV